MLKQLAKSVREYKRPSLFTLFLMVGEAVIESIIPFITAEKLINVIQQNGKDVKLSYVIAVGAVLAGMAMVSLACGGIAGLTCAKASAGFAKNLRGDVFRKIQKFSFTNIDKFSSSSLVTRLTTDITNVQMSYMMIIRIAVRSPLMLIFSVIMAAYMGGWLAATFAVVIPVLGLGLWLVSRRAMPAFHRVFRKYDRLNESVEENVRGMRVVKGFSREGYEKQKFGAAADDICNDFTKAERIVAFNTPLMNFCMYFNMLFILAVGAFLAIKHPESGINIGHISALLTYGMQVLMSLMMLSMVYVIITISAESAKRVCEVLSEEPDMTSPANALTEVADGSIDFENVNFKYSAEAAHDSLSDVNLHIKSGATVGIIGGTGSGKSSLVQLIPRLYDVSEGCVKVGGRDVREYDLDTLRGAVAMVLQKNLLFSGSIADNLRWGNENATEEEMIAACKLSESYDLVMAKGGFEAKIEQGGSNVSGGQKQRLCIARALLKKPKVLILDDSTSAVDTKTDAMIRAGFRSYIPETTKIIIAQRVASVEDADLILVMENGKIAAMGNHKELLDSCDIYREIYTQQTYGGGDAQ